MSEKIKTDKNGFPILSKEQAENIEKELHPLEDNMEEVNDEIRRSKFNESLKKASFSIDPERLKELKEEEMAEIESLLPNLDILMLRGMNGKKISFEDYDKAFKRVMELIKRR